MWINNIRVYSYSDNDKGYWIGLYLEKTGWTWLDGTQYNDSLDLWDDGQPDGFDDDEKCGKLWHKWHDGYCRHFGKFICKGSKWIY